jgi:NDP-sugar pyrophosphorylase family protein
MAILSLMGRDIESVAAAASSMHAVIQAGGRGQRIRPIAGSLAKPLLQVGDEPMIGRLIRQIASSGVQSATVVIPNACRELRDFLCQVAVDVPNLDLDVLEEQHPLGNAGALGAIECRGRTVLFCFADLVTELPFDRIAALHRERRCDITLASHYEFHQLSLGELITEGPRVCGYVEKPRKRFLICSGIAVFEPRILELARRVATPFGLADLINASLQAGYSVTHWMHEAYWIDVNTPELLQQARNDASVRAVQSL